MSESKEVYLSFIVICVFNGFFGYTAILLNIVTIYAIRKTSSLQKPLKTLLLSLAVSDLGVGLLVQPLYIAVNAMEIKQVGLTGSTYQYINKAFVSTAHFFTYASFFGVAALSADRFLAIYLHLRYRELVTHKRVLVVVISVWLLSEILSVATLWISQEASYFIFTTVVFVCLISIALLYCKIHSTVRYHKNQTQKLQLQQHQRAQNGETAQAKRTKKSSAGTFYVYLVLLVCYLPEISIHIVIHEDSAQNHWVRYLHLHLTSLVFLNSSLNPLIYCWKMRNIRHTLKDLAQRVFPLHSSRKAIDKSDSYCSQL